MTDMKPGAGEDVPIIESARPADWNAIRALVEAAGLPVDGLHRVLGTALVARQGAEVVGTAALELYADGALLRSVAVARAWRGRCVGRRLVQAAKALAREREMHALYLLTTTAAPFFEMLGFRRIARSDVPVSVRTSAEFTDLCPASAVVMMLDLTP